MSLPSELLPVGLLGTGATGGYEIERSLRFNSADSAYLSRTPASAGNRKTWTWAGWVKRSKLGQVEYIFSTGNPNIGQLIETLFFNSDNKIRLISVSEGVAVNWDLVTTQVFRDPSSWFHLCVSTDTTQAVSSNRIKIYINGIQITAFDTANYPGQNTDLLTNSTAATTIAARATLNDVIFNGYLADIHFIDGQALDPTSFGEFDENGIWQPIEYDGEYGTNGFHLDFSDNSAATATALGADSSGNGNNWTPNNFSVGSTINYSNSVTATGTYPPITNIRNAFDGNLSTATLNQVHSNPVDAFQTITFNTPFTNVTSVRVYGYTGDVNGTTGLAYRINDVAYQPSVDPGSYAVVWQDLSGQLSSTGNTVSSVSIQWDGNSTPSPRAGIHAIEINGVVLVDKELDTLNDSLIDVPTNGTQTDTGLGGEVRGNYATFSPLETLLARATLSNGNLEAASTNWGSSTIRFPASGKYYAEFTLLSFGAAQNWAGVALGAGAYLNYKRGGAIETTGGTTVTTVASYTTNDVIGVAVDIDASTVAFRKNGSQVYSGTYAAAGQFFAVYADSGSWAANFGQRPFAYQAPSGFKALNTANLPTPTILDGSDYMDVVTYTGNGSTQTISGLEFSPDLVWLKNRSAIGSHGLFDTVRGASKYLSSSSTDAESTLSGVSSFNADGFSLGSDWNQNTNSFAAWCWDAGSTTVTNTDGSITSSVRANPSAGFSIVTYTGTGATGGTVGHGLGVTPGLIIVKNRDSSSSSWAIYHQSLGKDKYLRLNSTDATTTLADVWGSGALTGSVFGVYAFSSSFNNGNGNSHIAYCFAPVDSYSSFGSYTGNGSSDGPFIFTGHRPRWILIKSASAAPTDWLIYDTARDTYNVLDNFLQPNTSSVEGTYVLIDALSNGFKIRNTGANGSGETVIYASFAENPFALNVRAR